MIIKEYRIPLPMTVEEYRIAQLYMIQVGCGALDTRGGGMGWRWGPHSTVSAPRAPGNCLNCTGVWLASMALAYGGAQWLFVALDGLSSAVLTALNTRRLTDPDIIPMRARLRLL